MYFPSVSTAARQLSRSFRPALLLAALALLLPACSEAGDEVELRDPDAYFFAQTFGDLPEEAAAAKASGKLGLLFFFEADACPYCQHMRRKVFSHPDVQEWFGERFVSIAIDIHGDVELTDFDGITLPSKVFSDHRQVFLTPVVAFVDFRGNENYRHLGMVRTPEDMLLLGRYVEGEHFYDTEFRVYAEQQGVQPQEALVTPGEESE